MIGLNKLHKLEQQVYINFFVHTLREQHKSCYQISAFGLINLYNPFRGYQVTYGTQMQTRL